MEVPRSALHLAVRGIGTDRGLSGGHSMLTDSAGPLPFLAIQHDALRDLPQGDVDKYVLSYLADVLDKDSAAACPVSLSSRDSLLSQPVFPPSFGDFSREDPCDLSGACLDLSCDELEPNHFFNDFSSFTSLPLFSPEGQSEFQFKKPDASSSSPTSLTLPPLNKANIPKTRHPSMKKFYPRRFSYSAFTSLPRYSLPSPAKTKRDVRKNPMLIEKFSFFRPKMRSSTFPLNRQQMNQVSHLEKLAQYLDLNRIREQNNDSNRFLYLRLTISIKTCEELLQKACTLYRLYRHLQRCLDGLRENKAMVGRIIHKKKEEDNRAQLNLLNSLSAFSRDNV